MKNFLTLLFVMIGLACHGAGLTVGSTNGSAVRLTATGTKLAGTTTNALGTVLVDASGNVYSGGYFGAAFDPLAENVQVIPGAINIQTINGTVTSYGDFNVWAANELGIGFQVGQGFLSINAAGGSTRVYVDRATGNMTNAGTIQAAAFVGSGSQLTGIIATVDPTVFNTNLFSGLLFPIATNTVSTIVTATNIYFTGLNYASGYNGRWGKVIIKTALNSNIIVTNPPSWFTSDAQGSRNLFSNQVMEVTVDAIPDFITNAAFSIFQSQ